MALSMSNTTIIGNVGKDPEVRFVGANSTKLAQFTVAVAPRWRKPDPGTGETKPDWYRVTAWGKDADFVETSISKGAKVCVVGDLALDEWNDKKNPSLTHFSLELRLRDIILLTAKPAAAAAGDNADMFDGNSDLPF